MNQNEYPQVCFRCLPPKLMSPKNTKHKSFCIYNPETLNINNTQLQLEKAKDELIKLKNELYLQRRELSNLKTESQVNEQEVNKSITSIQAILNIGDHPSKHIKDTNKYTPPPPLQKDIPLSNLLEQHYDVLTKQIEVKDNQLGELKKTGKATKLNRLNTNHNIYTTQLIELRKNYDLLKIQYNELQYRLAKTVDEKNSLGAFYERYKTQSDAYQKKETDLEKTAFKCKSKDNSNYSITDDERKTVAQLKTDNDTLKKQVEELTHLNKVYEQKGNNIQKDINSKDNEIKVLIKKLEQYDKDLQSMNVSDIKTFDNIITSLKSEIKTEKEQYETLNNNLHHKTQMTIEENKLCDIENQLDQTKSQNIGLNEILLDEKQRIASLNDINKKYDNTILNLEKELELLKYNRRDFFPTGIK